MIQHPKILHSRKDLAEITELAQNRTFCRGLTSQIEKGAEVSQTKNWDAKPQQVSRSILNDEEHNGKQLPRHILDTLRKHHQNC